MAKKHQEKLDYGALVRSLRENGPERLYLLYGEEDYLREQFLQELKKRCLERDTEEFNYRRLSREGFSILALDEAMNSMPFFSERILVEVRDFDINKIRENTAEELKTLLSDIPEYSTVVFVLETGYEPDGRLTLFKLFKRLGRTVEFTPQGQSALMNWISKRFASYGKQIGRREAEYLIFNCGSLMNGLIPEIDKVAAYCRGGSVSAEDIDAVTTRTPEANVFNMTDCIAAKDFNGAAKILSELLGMREESIRLLAIIGQQMRRLFVARTAIDTGEGAKYVMDVCELHYDFIAKKLIDAAKGFDTTTLAYALELCADTDYAMKSGGGDSVELLKELLLRLAVGEAVA